MPEIDGLTATAMIREKEKRTNGHVPIIAMTAHAMRGDQERCIEAGMDDYVPKPISAAALLDAIHRVVSMPDRGVAPESAADSSTADDIDELAAYLEAFNNDGAFFKEVVEMFISDYPPMLEAAKKAIEDRDADSLSRTAHSLKGMARNFQIEEAVMAARHLEESADQRQFETAREQCRRLTDTLTTFARRLTRMTARLQI
jgi:CheY-like chemotaxis protein